MNLHIIVGRVGQDPEVTYLPSGTAVCNVGIATDDPYKDADGNFAKRTTWHRVAFFGRQAESLAEHVRKGRSIAVHGTVRRRKDEESGVVYVDTVARSWEFAGSGKGGGRNGGTRGGNGNGNNRGRQQTRRGGQQQRGGSRQAQRQAPPDEDFDDIPF